MKAWQKPLRWYAPWRSWAVQREWDRQVKVMAEYRRTGWASWEER